MTSEEKIAQQLVEYFTYLENKVIVLRSRRISLEVDIERFREVFDYLVKRMKFISLCAITGLDEGVNLALIYHLAQDKGIVINLKTSVPKDNPVLSSVIPYFPSAEVYEREVVDLFGFEIQGLPEGSRYPLPDDWPKDEFPLRKDWKQKEGV